MEVFGPGFWMELDFGKRREDSRAWRLACIVTDGRYGDVRVEKLIDLRVKNDTFVDISGMRRIKDLVGWKMKRRENWSTRSAVFQPEGLTDGRCHLKPEGTLMSCAYAAFVLAISESGLQSS